MIFSIRVSDETYLLYAGYDANSPQRAIERQVERFKDYSPTDRAVLLRKDIARAVEKLYGKPIEDQDDFRRWLERMVSLKVGHVEIPLSEGQLKRLQTWADKMEQPFVEYVERRISNVVATDLGGI